MKWYRVGEMGDAVELVVESFLEGFLTYIAFAEELARLGLSFEEQMDVLQEEIERHEKMMLALDGNGTIH